MWQKIWKDNFGEIPIDDLGRSYEIHHINGDRSDNRIENLQCLTIQEHFDIHFSQGDYSAVAAIARRMNIPLDEQRRLNSLAGKQAFLKGTGIHKQTPEERKALSRKGGLAMIGMKWWTNGFEQVRAKEPPFPDWIRGKIKDGRKYGYEKGRKLGLFWNNGFINKRFLENPGDGWKRGKLLNEEQTKRRKEIASKNNSIEHNRKISIALKGRKPPIIICPKCLKHGKGSAMWRWHFDNCKEIT